MSVLVAGCGVPISRPVAARLIYHTAQPHFLTNTNTVYGGHCSAVYTQVGACIVCCSQVPRPTPNGSGSPMSLKVGNFLFRLVQLTICFSGSPIHRPILFSTTKCCAGAHFSPQCCVYEALHNYDNYCTACSWQCLVLVLYAK